MKKLFLFAATASMAMLFAGCEKKEVKEVSQTNDAQTYATIGYGVFIDAYAYEDIAISQIETMREAKQLTADINLMEQQGFDASSKKNDLNNLCGLKFDKQIHWGDASIIYVKEDYVLMGDVAVYSNYRGTKTIFYTGVSIDVAELCGTTGDMKELTKMQMIDEGLEKYSYTVTNNMITIKDKYKTKLRYKKESKSGTVWKKYVDENYDNAYVGYFL